MKKSRANGFSLIEMMMAIMVAAVVVGLAIPSMADFGRNNRLATGTNDLLRSLQMARAEAIKRQLTLPRSVIVCASADPTSATPSCGGAGTPFLGWFSFEDRDGNWQYTAGETIIEQHPLLDATMFVRTDASSIVSYTLTGFSTATGPNGETASGNVIMCDKRGNAADGTTDSTARAVIIDRTGRSRVSRNRTVITDIIANNGTLSCPA
jgi:type IV fimbrial biogenesis protein FimT